MLQQTSSSTSNVASFFLLEQQVDRSKKPLLKDITGLFKNEFAVSSEEALKRGGEGSIADVPCPLCITEVTPGLAISEYLGHVHKIKLLRDFV